MKVFNFTTARPNMGGTRTYEDFTKFLGSAPHRLGIMSRMYPDLTASYLTESLMNIYTNSKSHNRFQSIDAFLFEWEIDVNHIKRVEFAAVPTGTGANGAEIIMAFKERYYEQYDIFRIEGSRQTCAVKTSPIRKADDYWEVIVQLVDNDYQSVLDVSACQVGMTTRFLSNAVPELHEIGFSKSQSNIERHRNYITTHRNDASYSAQYAALEDVFVTTSKNGGKGTSTETVYQMKTVEKELLDSFLEARNNALLFGKCNVDANGKSTLYDRTTNRPIIMGDGIINQVERYANRYGYAKLSINAFDTVMDHMRQKSKSSTGNQYVFIVNERLWSQIQRVLREYLKDFRTDGTFFYSQKSNKNVSVGATFDTYIYGGNQLTFHVDKALTLEYPDKGWGMVIDLTADATTNTPALAMFTVKGGEFMQHTLLGPGGLDGTSSGAVASPVAGVKLIHWGYAGVGVMNPYRSYILFEN